MERVVDEHKSRARSSSSTDVALARNLILGLTDASRDLRFATAREMAGHAIGDQLVLSCERAVAALDEAHARLARAAALILSIDVTVEIPDREPPTGEYRYGH